MEIRSPSTALRAAIALVNLSAMTLFLWHQTAFVTVSSVGLLAGRVPGLWLAFRRVERGEPHPRSVSARNMPGRLGWRSHKAS